VAQPTEAEKTYFQVYWEGKKRQQLFSVSMTNKTNSNRFKLHQESFSINTKEGRKGKQCSILAVVPVTGSSRPHWGQTHYNGAAHASRQEHALDTLLGSSSPTFLWVCETPTNRL